MCKVGHVSVDAASFGIRTVKGFKDMSPAMAKAEQFFSQAKAIPWRELNFEMRVAGAFI